MIDLSLTDNVSDFDDALLAYIKGKKVTVAHALRTQGRLLAKRLIDLTPPQGGRSQGTKATTRDIRKPISPFDDILRYQKKSGGILTRHPKLLKALRRYAEADDTHAIFDILTKLGWNISPEDVTRYNPRQHHERWRRRGRVPGKGYARKIIVDSRNVRDYIKRRRDNVGMARGGWAASVIALGGTVPAWIGRHASQGRIEDHSTDPVTPYIRLFNRSPWTQRGDEGRIRANALRSRAQNIRTELFKSSVEDLKKVLKR